MNTNIRYYEVQPEQFNKETEV